MAIIGFIVLLCIGAYLTIAAVGMFFVGLAFGSTEGFAGLMFAALAVAVFWFAFTHSPFTISLVTQ